MPRHVALIGKARSVGGVGERDAASDLRPHTLQATADQVPVRRGAEPSAEAARKCVTVEAGLGLQRRGAYRAGRHVKEIPRRIEGFRGEAPRDGGGPGKPRQGVGQCGKQSRNRQVFDRLWKVDKSIGDNAAQDWVVENRHGDEWQRPAAQGGGNQRWVGIKHPIGEPAGRARMAIVRLVGMEHDDPSRRARTCSAAIVEALQPCLGDANRIGLVPVPIVGVPRKAGPQPLHAGSGRFDDQEIAGNGHHLSRTNVQDGSRGDARMRGMMYSTKTALVIRADLSPWQVANVAAFLSGGLADGYPEIVGEPYRDGDGRLYTPMIREPIFVYAASSAELARTHGRAVSRNLRFAIYTEPLFKTANDADNRASVAATPTAALDLVGLGLHADRKIVDKVTAGLKFLP